MKNVSRKALVCIMLTGLITSPVRLVHNYTGVLLSLIISGFPFTFLLTLSYVTDRDLTSAERASPLGVVCDWLSPRVG